MTNSTTNNQDSVIASDVIKLVVNAWSAQNKAMTNYFNKYQEEDFLHEVAPGRNRGIYLLGHLVAVNDGLLPLLGFGEKLYPELPANFIAVPDSKTMENFPTVAELKQKWDTVIEKLINHFNAMQPQDWLAKHTAVSDDDFAINPTRNKLNVLIGRTNHQSYHLGQMNLIRAKELVA